MIPNFFYRFLFAYCASIASCYFLDTHSFLPFWITSSLAIVTIERAYPFYRNLSKSLQIITLCLWGLPFLFISLDDDSYRYIWEGYAFLHGENPYLISPEMSSLSSPIKTLVNHPKWTAIYGPLFIEGMALLSWLQIPVLFLKFLWLCLHVANAFLLKKITQSSYLSFLFLTSPFILIETVGQGHFETILITGACLIILAIKTSSTFLYVIGVSLSLWIKWWLIPLYLFIFKKNFIKAQFWVLALSLLILSPFLSAPSHLWASLIKFESLQSYGYIHSFISHILPETHQIIITLILFGRATYLFFLGGRFQNQIWEFSRWAIFLSPTIHPWYLILPLTLALIEGQKVTFICMGALSLGFHQADLLWESKGVWENNFLIAIPFFLCLLTHEKYLLRLYPAFKGEFVPSFSIITPVLNESDNLDQLGQNLATHRHWIKEWIVVDAGSKDQSIQIAQQWNAKVIHSEIKGRGNQIYQGIQNANSEWIIIIHADSRLSYNAFLEIQKAIMLQPNAVGGAIKMCYRDYQHLGPLFFLNDIKTRLAGISFGDQSQFLKKSKLKECGGYPELTLMEDLELSLLWQGKVTLFLDQCRSSTSPRRWKKMGRLKNSILIIRLIFDYLVKRQFCERVNIEPLYKKYYH